MSVDRKARAPYSSLEKGGSSMIDRVQIDERPRERLVRAGPAALSLRELVALLLGSGPKGLGCLGVADQLLSRHCQDPARQDEAFFRVAEAARPDVWLGTPGIGPAGRARLAAAFELGRRYALYRADGASPRRARHGPSVPALIRQCLDRIPSDLRSAPQEWLGFVPVDVGGRAGPFVLVERGTRTHVNVDPAELFAQLLAWRPVLVLLAHNHPCGDLTASEADRTLTALIEETLERIHVGFLGHYVVAGPHSNVVR